MLLFILIQLMASPAQQEVKADDEVREVRQYAGDAYTACWFVTPNVLLKGEYVRQTFDGWDSARVLSGGRFDGLVIQGAVTF